MNTTLTFTDLQTLTGYKRQADVERCLKKQHVRFLVGREGPFTTVAALNNALGVGHDGGSVSKPIEF